MNEKYASGDRAYSLQLEKQLSELQCLVSLQREAMMRVIRAPNPNKPPETVEKMEIMLNKIRNAASLFREALEATQQTALDYEKRVKAEALREAQNYFRGRSDYAVREIELLACELEGKS